VRIFFPSDVVVLPTAQVKSKPANSSKSNGCDISLHQRHFLHPIKNVYSKEISYEKRDLTVNSVAPICNLKFLLIEPYSIDFIGNSCPYFFDRNLELWQRPQGVIIIKSKKGEKEVCDV